MFSVIGFVVAFLLLGLALMGFGIWAITRMRPRQRARGLRVVDAMATVVNHERRRRPDHGGTTGGTAGGTGPSMSSSTFS